MPRGSYLGTLPSLGVLDASGRRRPLGVLDTGRKGTPWGGQTQRSEPPSQSCWDELPEQEAGARGEQRLGLPHGLSEPQTNPSLPAHAI